MTVDRQTLFGNDILLQDEGGTLDFSLAGRVSTSGDLGLAVGNDNIAQALRLRLMVRKGELAQLGWPEYGSRLEELIGEPDLPRTQLKAQVFAREAIEADPRVLKVQSIDIASVPGERSVLRLSMVVLLIVSPTPLDLVFDLALEGQ